MVKVLRIFGEQIFPERQLLLKSSNGIRHIALPGWLQAAVIVACLTSVGGIAYLAVGFERLHEALDQRIDEIHSMSGAVDASAASDANLDDLRGEVTQLRHDLATVTQNLDDANARYQATESEFTSATAKNNKLKTDLSAAAAHVRTAQDARDAAEHRAKVAEQALNSKEDSVSELARNLGANRSELQQSEAERTTLQNRVQQLEMELQASNDRVAQLTGQPAAKDNQLRQVAKEPAPGQAAGAQLDSTTPPSTPAPGPHHKMSAPSPHAEAGTKPSELKSLLASTGVDIDRLMKSMGATNQGEGGPYIALNSPQAKAYENKRRIQELMMVARMLPLHAPLKHYDIDSGFGARVDPINHRPSFHPGIDMAAPYKTLVYATAPGRVIFTGWEEGYGRIVKIDHGHGIVTIYAHLHRILVARGQRVGIHTRIGELGDTGRSTGPHLHYGIYVDGTPLNPAKFLEAGKNVVQISAKQ